MELQEYDTEHRRICIVAVNIFCLFLFLFLNSSIMHIWKVKLLTVGLISEKTLVTLGITITVKHNISLHGEYYLAFYIPFKNTPLCSIRFTIEESFPL